MALELGWYVTYIMRIKLDFNDFIIAYRNKIANNYEIEYLNGLHYFH